MPDIAARPRSLTLAVQASARSPGTLAARIAPAPPSRGAADPCCPTRSPPPLRATATTRGRCLSPTSATDPQHEHPQNRSTPSQRPPCGALCAGESPVDASLPASVVLQTLSLRFKKRSAVPYRRCPAAAFSAAHNAQRARPLTLPVTSRSAPREAGRTSGQERFRRDPVKSHDFHAPERLPSTDAPSPPTCAGCDQAVTVLAAFPPTSQLPTTLFATRDRLQVAAFAVSLASLPEQLHCLEVRVLPPTWTEQVCLLSTSAITTVLEHDSGSD
jgi:hypothetical protein